MANTIAKVARDYPASLTAKLVSAGGTGTPNASGYVCSASAGMQTFTVAEALIGLFYVYLYDSGGEIAWQGFIDLLDDTSTYYAFNDVPVLVQAKAASGQATTAATQATAAAASASTASAQATAAANQTTASAIRTAVGLESANLSHAVNALVGKTNVLANGDGTYNIAIRNGADNATLVTVQYNPTTGTKTVV